MEAIETLQGKGGARGGHIQEKGFVNHLVNRGEPWCEGGLGFSKLLLKNRLKYSKNGFHRGVKSCVQYK